MRFEIAMVLWLGCACASSQEVLIQRRSAIRARAEEAANLKVATYRSAEGVRGTHWGMTMAEVIAAKGEPDQQTSDAYMYVDLVNGSKAPTVYSFFEGRLAHVTSQFAPEALGLEALEKAMTLKYGAPTWNHDKASELARARDAGEQADVALAILGGAALAANLASNSSRTFFPFYWGSYRRHDELRRALEMQAKPARDVMWSTRETRVHWVKLDSGYSTINWGSAVLAPRLAARQESVAGLQALAKDL